MKVKVLCCFCSEVIKLKREMNSPHPCYSYIEIIESNLKCCPKCNAAIVIKKREELDLELKKVIDEMLYDL